MALCSNESDLALIVKPLEVIQSYWLSIKGLVKRGHIIGK
jgi:hypothetical protein